MASTIDRVRIAPELVAEAEALGMDVSAELASALRARIEKRKRENAWRDENRSRPLEYDEESGELSPEVEAAAGAYNPFAASDFDNAAYRLRLDAAIEALPTEQSRIIHMLSQGFPIDSKEEDVMTIAKALGRSGRSLKSLHTIGDVGNTTTQAVAKMHAR